MDQRLAIARSAFDNGDYTGSLSHLSELMDHRPDEALLMLLGETLARLGHASEAASAYEQAADLAGPDAYLCRKRAARQHLAAGADEEAQLIALKLLGTAPDDPELAFILVSIFLKTGEIQLVNALKNRLVASDDPEHLLLASRLISGEPHNAHNLPLFRKLAGLYPDDPYIRMNCLDFARAFCDFDTVAREEAAIRTRLAAGDLTLLAGLEPHAAIMWLEDEALLRKADNLGSFKRYSEETRTKRRSQPHQWQEKLRIGYVSGDFWDDHATMRLLGEVLRQHDREAFDITLFCNTPARYIGFDQGGRKGWGRIIPIRDLDDAGAEKAIRAAGIDILVDLKGHTGDNRSQVFNRMAAPVQVAWLGFPGSSIGVDCDYIIGDRHVLPDAAAPHFHEAFCRLPESYQPNDPVSRPLPPAASRRELGLPEDVFLFTSFNATRKLTPKTLDLWCRVLRQAPLAHLWIMGPEQQTRACFESRGIDPARIHVAPKVAYPGHVARVQAADLGLDCCPCNGHTTTSDLLWAGLPVVTAKGSTFAGRVSESLLHAIGLPELVAEDEDGFVALAAGLARDPARLAKLRQRLAENRFTAPLFDAERFCRHLESAYRGMADRARAGKPPEPFDVDPLPVRTGSFRPA